MLSNLAKIMHLVGFSLDRYKFHPLTCWCPKETQKTLAPGGSEKQPKDGPEDSVEQCAYLVLEGGTHPFNILILENQINVYQEALLSSGYF